MGNKALEKENEVLRMSKDNSLDQNELTMKENEILKKQLSDEKTSAKTAIEILQKENDALKKQLLDPKSVSASPIKKNPLHETLSYSYKKSKSDKLIDEFRSLISGSGIQIGQEEYVEEDSKKETEVKVDSKKETEPSKKPSSQKKRQQRK